MSELKKALAETNITIRKFDSSKVRPVYTAKTSVSVSKFTDELVAGLGSKLLEHPAIVETINNPAKMEVLLEAYASEENLLPVEGVGEPITISPDVAHLTLNVDTSSKEPGSRRFFCTTKEEFVDIHTSGQMYLDLCGISPQEAIISGIARQVVPRYMPRRSCGIHVAQDEVTQKPVNFYNTYIPAKWIRWKNQNPRAWEKLRDTPPEDIIRLLKHLIPLKDEREYLYAYIYHSLVKRAYVFLVLQANPGVGKNRLKILFTALHGETNSVAGKKETFGANQSKFNSQMEEATNIWFDELKYDAEMEPRMKEYQNDYIPIEKKGLDTTRSTEIFCTMPISNNYPRDNYLLFNSRKFVPLVMGEKPLTEVMKPEEIEKMSNRLDESRPEYDVKYVAQIAKWIYKVGRKHHDRWPNLEYQGPKFWELAHSSMSRWQKIAVLALTVQNMRGPFAGWDDAKQAFLWSKVEESLRRKKEYESKDYRDSTTVKAFFDTYRDSKGKKVFDVEVVDKSVVKDFWVKPIEGLKKIKGGISLEAMIEDSEDMQAAKDHANGNGHSNGNGHTNGNGHHMTKPKLERPPNISDYKWRQMKEAWDEDGVHHEL